MHPRFLTLLLAAVAASAIAGSHAGAQVRVVTTHADLAALTLAVGGSHVKVTNLCQPTQDPHFVDARPHLMLSINRADLVVVVGLGLETGWLPTLLTGARNPDVMPGAAGYLDTSTAVQRLGVPQGTIDRSQGDLHAGGNPHFLRAPPSGLRVAAAIARHLSRLDAPNASAYRRGYARLERELRAAMEGWAARLAPFRGTEVVGYHTSWVYFAAWAGLKLELFVEPKPGIPPDPAHAAALLGQMTERRIGAILQEEYYPDATSALLARKSGARLVSMPGGARVQSGETYVAYVGRQVDLLAAALEAGVR